MANIISTKGKLSLTRRDEEEEKNKIVSTKGKLSLTKQTESSVPEKKKEEDALFASSSPVLPGPSNKFQLTPPSVSLPGVKNQGNLLSMNVGQEQKRRALIDEQIEALEEEKKLLNKEKDLWSNSQFKGPKWAEVDAQIQAIDRQIAQLDRSTWSQDVIDSAEVAQGKGKETDEPKRDSIAKATFWDAVGEFNKGVTSSLAFAEGLISKPIDKAFGDGEGYKNWPLYRLNEYFSDIEEGFTQDYEKALENATTGQRVAAEVGKGVIAAIPQAMTAFVSGGASAAARGAQLSTANAGLVARVGDALKTMVRNPSYWGSVVQTLGPTYEEEIRGGASELRASVSAILSTALNAGVELGGGLENIPDTPSLRAWVKNMLDEGKEEVVQGVISGITSKAISRPEKEVFSLQNEDAIINPGRMAKEFGLGAAVGGILGGAQIGTQAALQGAANRSERARQQQATDAQLLVAEQMKENAQMPATRQKVQTQPTQIRAEDELERTGREAGAAEQDVATARRIADALGVRIAFYSTPETAQGMQNGRYENGTIYINSKSRNQVAQIISHELTHSVELADVYGQLSGIVLNRIQKTGGNLEQLRQAKIDLYKRNGVTLQDQAAVDAELVAEFIEKNLLTNEEQILSLANENRTVAQKIHDWIDNVLAKLGNSAAQERTFLTNAKDLYAKALAQSTAKAPRQTAPVQVQQQTRVQPVQVQRQTQPKTTSQPQVQPVQQPVTARAEQQGVEESAKRQEIRAELERLSEQLAAGEISEEEFDAIYEAAMQEPEMQDGLFSISDPQEKQDVLSSLRKYLDGGMSLQELNERIGARGSTQSQTRKETALSEDAQKIKNAARRQRMSVQEYVHQNWELFDVDGEWNQAAKEAIDDERGVRYSFAGEKARTADAEALERAKQMQKQGEDPNVIFRETGWFQGAEGMWRFEIDDSGMQYSEKKEGTIGRTLESFVTHDELFEAYPQMKEIRLVFDQMPQGVMGSYRPATNTITLSNELRDAPESAIVHEVQHAIQRIEGFETGATREYWQKKLDNGYDGRTQLQREEAKRLWQEYNSIRENEPEFFDDMMELAALTPDVPRGEINWDTLEKIKEDPIEWKRYDEAREKLEEQYGEEKVWDFNDLRYKLKQVETNQGRSATDLYYATAGEIEARDVESRRRMSEQERRERMPDTGNKDTVFTSQNVAYSITEPFVDEEGNTYEAAVLLDTDAFDGVAPRSWWKVLKKKIENKARQSTFIMPVVDEKGEVQNLEFARPEDRVRKNDGAWHTALSELYQTSDNISKLAAIHVDEVVEVSDESEPYYSSPDEHGWLDENGWLHRTAYVINSKNGNIYQITMDIAKARDGRVILYALNGKTKKVGNAKVNSLKLRGSTQNSNFENNVTQDQDEVKYSFSEEESETQPGQEEPFFEVDRNTLNTKAANYLQGTERALERAIGRALDVPGVVQREDLRGIVQRLSDQYLMTGRVHPETMTELFEKAYANGIKVDDAFFNENKDVRDYLRTQAITLSDADKSSFADWNEFRQRSRGLLRLSKNGLPVDSAYQELQAMAPGLFPEIYAPADQLQRMRDVSASIKKVEKTLDEYYGPNAEEFKRWAKADFETAVNEHLSQLQQVRRYAQEQAAKQKELQTPESIEEVMTLYSKMKEQRRTKDKVRAKNLLTERDEQLLGRLHRGEIRAEDLPEDSNVRGIEAVYEAEREYERTARVIREYNRKRKTGLKQEADEFLQTANGWKDKKTGLQYSRETQERNIRDIVPDEALAQRIIDRYFTPVHEAQAAATRMKNEFRQKVKAMNLSRKVEKGNLVSEAHAVQLLGEAEDNIHVLENSRGRMKVRDGKTLAEWQAVVQNLWKENPKLNEAKIRKAVNEFRGIYDRLFQQMNETRVRNGYEPINYRQGYFPHFQPNDTDGMLGAFSKALGIDMQTMALPTSINGLTHTFKPGIQWLGNAQERLGFNTAYDAVEGFDKYIEGVADVIYQTDNIQAQRALASQIRYRTTDEGIRKQVDEVMEKADLSDEDKKNRIEKIYENGKYTLSNFVVDLEEYTNLLANKKSRADRNMEQAMGRGMYQLVKALESRVAANMVAVNPGSWITNLIPLTQGGAQLNKGNLLRGMWDTLKNYKVHDGFEGRSAFLTNRRGSDPLVRTWAQAASGVMSQPMEYIDTFVADSLVRARTRQNMQAGMSEDAAIREADAWASGVMADRSKGSLPTLFNRSNPMTKLFTQFQLEVNNQMSYLFKDLPREQKKKGILALTTALLKFFLGAWLYNEIYEYFIGRRPALDPVGMLNDAVGDLTGYEMPNLLEAGEAVISGEDVDFTTEKQNRYDAVYNLFVGAAEELPFVGGLLGGGRIPIQSALPDFQNLGKVVFNENWSTEKKLATAGKELMNPASYLLLPFGGGQIKKVLQGVKATIEGGRYTVDAEGNQKLQYPVYKEEALTAAIFGPTATTTGRQWIEEGFPTLGKDETAAYQGLLENGVDEQTAYELIRNIRAAEKTETMSEAEHERQVLRDAEMDSENKGIIYYASMASDKERALIDALTDEGDNLGAMYEMLDGIREAGSSNEKRTAIMDSGLSDLEKKLTYQYMMGTLQDDGTYATSRDDDILAFHAAGLGMDEFLSAQNAYTEIGELYSGASDKAVEFSRWINRQGFTESQKQVAKEAFKFYSQIPQTETKYDTFVQSGLDDDTAYQLGNAISALKPENGKASVSARQKYKAVADQNLSDDDTMKAFETIMTESEYKKVTAAYEMALSPKVYAQVKYFMQEYDANGNGSYSNEEIEEAIDAYVKSNRLLRLDNGDKAILWQALTGSTSTKNNPYSKSVARDYLERLEE